MLKSIARFLAEPRQKNRSDFGLVLDWRFHTGNCWVSACMPFLVEALLEEFRPIIISSQRQYERCKKDLRFVLSFEPGWAAPKLVFDRRFSCCKAVMYSDPHFRPEERRRYFDDNGFDQVLSLYREPFFLHLKGFPKEKFVHFPWAVPDRFVTTAEPTVRSNQVAIFGGRSGDSYDVRNWCRGQEGVSGYDFSGVENKKLSDAQYYTWLRGFDAMVAAGSSSPAYSLVTPKYFEIAGAGALLIGQECGDLAGLGFTEENSIIFTKDDFNDKIATYRRTPEAYLETRRRGVALIRSRHLISHRVETIRKLYEAA